MSETPRDPETDPADHGSAAAASATGSGETPGGSTPATEPAGPDPLALVEAFLFAASEPVEEREIQALLGARAEAGAVLERLRARYREGGVRLERIGRAWAFRTAPELAPWLARTVRPLRRLSRAAMETLAVIAWHQPVTRAEIEAVRGVSLSAGTLDLLVEIGWVTPKGRREAPGRPLTWGTTPAFLDAFGLSSLADLPKLEELAAGGLFKPPTAD
jgi:segregation and condensation protein B